MVAINIIAFISMGYDKKRAEKHKWRVSEGRLFFLALIFGAFGIWLGMYFFRHKTKHMKFVFGIPLILAVQLLITCAYLKFGF